MKRAWSRPAGVPPGVRRGRRSAARRSLCASRRPCRCRCGTSGEGDMARRGDDVLEHVRTTLTAAAEQCRALYLRPDEARGCGLAPVAAAAALSRRLGRRATGARRRRRRGRVRRGRPLGLRHAQPSGVSLGRAGSPLSAARFGVGFRSHPEILHRRMVRAPFPDQSSTSSSRTPSSTRRRRRAAAVRGRGAAGRPSRFRDDAEPLVPSGHAAAAGPLAAEGGSIGYDLAGRAGRARITCSGAAICGLFPGLCPDRQPRLNSVAIT
jgi:hypothetical protein